MLRTAVQLTWRSVSSRSRSAQPSHKNSRKRFYSKGGYTAVLGWGDNSVGQLGLGRTASAARAAVVPLINNVKVRHVAASEASSIFVTDIGQAWSCGASDEGQVAQRGTKKRPTTIELSRAVTHASLGKHHVLLLTDKGEVYSAGLPQAQLGYQTSDTQFQPRLVQSLAGVRVTHVIAGAYHSLAIDDQGQLHVWGTNMSGQLGTGDDTYVWEPVRVMTGHVIKRAVAGLSHTLVLTDKGELYGWGVNKLNQLGIDKSVRQVMTPRALLLPALEDGEKIVDLASGLSHTLLYTDRGNVYAFGANQYGQAGTGKLEPSVMPSRVLSGLGSIRHIACGNFTSFCVTQSNNVYVWGLGSDYQLCSGQKELVLKPTELTDPNFKDFDVLQIASGWSHTLARVRLKPNKTLEQLIGSQSEESE